MKNSIAKNASVDRFVEEEEENIVRSYSYLSSCVVNDEYIKSNGGCYTYLSNLGLQILCLF